MHTIDGIGRIGPFVEEPPLANALLQKAGRFGCRRRVGGASQACVLRRMAILRLITTFATGNFFPARAPLAQATDRALICACEPGRLGESCRRTAQRQTRTLLAVMVAWACGGRDRA
eukprot:1789368-Prymnesium_polylepis.3